LPIEPVPTLLGPLDPPAVTVRDFGQRRPAVVVCDHASNAVPRSLAALGLTAAVLARHVAWDIGAGALSEALAERLGLTCVLAGYSRLVVDCNRDPAGAASMLATSDGVRIPGNQSLSARIGPPGSPRSSSLIRRPSRRPWQRLRARTRR
jgi:predicted N-formylglutamate amidohydrolase